MIEEYRLCLRLALRCLLVMVVVPLLGGAAKGQTWGNPVWSAEFNASVPGTPPDPAKWTFDVGGSGWGNNELETYCAPGSSTPRPCDAAHPNAFQDGRGHLVIEAIRTSPNPAPTGTWTSARLKTRGLAEFQYGRIEACVKLPVGAGLWPAFWALGTAGHWPSGGEIDIMENVPATGGLGPRIIESTLNGPDARKPLYSIDKDFTFPGGGRVDDVNPANLNCPYHIYGVIWSPFMVQFYVDNWRAPFYVRTLGDLPAGGKWVFNRPDRFYLLLNLAIGGKWPGNPSPATPSPARMLVDYVRVYKPARAAGPTMSARPILVRVGETGSSTLHLTSVAGTGRAYLSCSGGPQGTTCSINTGNPLSPSVVDFSSRSTGTAAITVNTHAIATGGTDHFKAKPGAYDLTVTAYTVSGSESTLHIPLSIN